jgi:hypothetical protein
MPTRISNINKVSVHVGPCACPKPRRKRRPVGAPGSMRSRTDGASAPSIPSQGQYAQKYMISNSLGGSALIRNGVPVVFDTDRRAGDDRAREQTDRAFHGRMVASQRAENERFLGEVRESGKFLGEALQSHAEFFATDMEDTPVSPEPSMPQSPSSNMGGGGGGGSLRSTPDMFPTGSQTPPHRRRLEWPAGGSSSGVGGPDSIHHKSIRRQPEDSDYKEPPPYKSLSHHDASGRVSCPQCARTFANRGNLNRHVKNYNHKP